MRFILQGLSSTTQHLRGKLHKSVAHCLWWKLKIYIRTQPKWLKQWKQGSVNKQVLEILFLITKMCTGFATDVIWMNTKVSKATSKPFQSSSKKFCYWLIDITEHLRGKLQEREVAITSRLLAVKAKNTYPNTTKTPKTMKRQHSQLFNSFYKLCSST